MIAIPASSLTPKTSCIKKRFRFAKSKTSVGERNTLIKKNAKKNHSIFFFLLWNICLQKKCEKSLDSSEKSEFKRSTSLKSLRALSVLNTVRRASEIPSAHYVARGPTDASNNTETTTVGRETTFLLISKMLIIFIRYD